VLREAEPRSTHALDGWYRLRRSTLRGSLRSRLRVTSFSLLTSLTIIYIQPIS